MSHAVCLRGLPCLIDVPAVMEASVTHQAVVITHAGHFHSKGLSLQVDSPAVPAIPVQGFARLAVKILSGCEIVRSGLRKISLNFFLNLLTCFISGNFHIVPYL